MKPDSLKGVANTIYEVKVKDHNIIIICDIEMYV